MTTIITEEFSETITSLLNGKNVLITGRAGTGKSTLLNYFIKEHLKKRNYLITAPTGVAALNIEGVTIHKAFGLRPGQYPDDVSSENYRISPSVKSTLKALEVLIVDEVSMVRADLFDMMDVILRRARKTTAPFGGIQLILVGDLLQLPPVVSEFETKLFQTRWKTPYFFSAKCYPELPLEIVELTQIWRQKDESFIELLNQVREGEVLPELLSLLNSKVTSKFTYEDGWVTLTSLRKSAEKINNEQLAHINVPYYESEAVITGEAQDRQFPGSELFQYKVGARVMAVINDPNGKYANGSFGTIIAASPDEIQVYFDNNNVENIHKHTWEFRRPVVTDGKLSSASTGSITQFPLILAWAITIHKSQGKTIPKCQIALEGGTKSEGQFYVALSRAVSLDNLRLSRNVTARNIRANGQIVRMINRNTIPDQPIQKHVAISFEAVSFRISQHIVHIHCTVLENDVIMADFGSWINPNSDYGTLGEKYNIPAFGLAPAPTLRDFWPLLRRQVAGGIVIGDHLSVLERAIRHQEPGLKVNLGIGYDAFELEFSPVGDSPEERCHSIIHALKSGTIIVERGHPAPKADKSDEGALFIPQWAPNESTELDLSKATDSDIAWSAMSFGSVNPNSTAKIQECINLLALWADSRNGWNTQWQKEISSRAHRITNDIITVPEVTHVAASVPNLLTRGTRVAFTGAILINRNIYSDDNSRKELCEATGLVYKRDVSKTACDVLIASDPSSMSGKAKKARRFNKPIISCEQFEDWYNNQILGFKSQTSVEEPRTNNNVEASSLDEGSIDSQSVGTPAFSETIAPSPTVVYTPAEEILKEGSNVAFSGEVKIDNRHIAHGPELQELCANLGIVYKDSVSSTLCDALVVDLRRPSTKKVELATVYGIPLVSMASFAEWATRKLHDKSIDVSHGTTIENKNVSNFELETPEVVEDSLSEHSQVVCNNDAAAKCSVNTDLPVTTPASFESSLESTAAMHSLEERRVSVFDREGGNPPIPESGIINNVNSMAATGFIDEGTPAKKLPQTMSPAAKPKSNPGLVHKLFGSNSIASPTVVQHGSAALTELFINRRAAWSCQSQEEFLDRVSEGRNPFGISRSKASTPFFKLLALFPASIVITIICGLIMQVHYNAGGVIYSIIIIAGFCYGFFCLVQAIARLIRGPRWNVKKAIQSIESRTQSSIEDRFAVLFLNKESLTPLHQQVLSHMEAFYAESAFYKVPLQPKHWRELTISALQAVDAYQIGNSLPAEEVAQRLADIRAQYE